MSKKYATLLFGIWFFDFLLLILMTYLMFSMKWIINNSWLSFAQSQGDTYWKGFFIQCRTDYAVNGITCHNYQFPWFQMDGVLLSNRILYVLSWIFMIFVPDTQSLA